MDEVHRQNERVVIPAINLTVQLPERPKESPRLTDIPFDTDSAISFLRGTFLQATKEELTNSTSVNAADPMRKFLHTSVLVRWNIHGKPRETHPRWIRCPRRPVEWPPVFGDERLVAVDIFSDV